MKRALMLLPLVLAVLAAARARAADSIVPDDFATIQAALDAAMPGDTVSVRDTPGPWFEKIVFPRSGTPGSPITRALKTAVCGGRRRGEPSLASIPAEVRPATTGDSLRRS